MKTTLATLLICTIINTATPTAAPTGTTANPQGWRELLCKILPCK